MASLGKSGLAEQVGGICPISKCVGIDICFVYTGKREGGGERNLIMIWLCFLLTLSWIRFYKHKLAYMYLTKSLVNLIAKQRILNFSYVMSSMNILGLLKIMYKQFRKKQNKKNSNNEGQ